VFLGKNNIKNNLKKNISMTQIINSKFAAITALVILSFASCKSDEPTVTDDRDKFVGTYDITTTGSIVFPDLNYTAPFNAVDVLTITKDNSSDNLVNITGFYEAKATVTGNSIKIDQMIESGVIDGVNVQMTASPRTGTINGGVLTFMLDMSMTMSLSGYTYVGTGVVQNVATKR
jgi:hypothetical protein